MANQYTRAQEFWGYLINRDKTPTPLLEQLLLGLANYIVGSLVISFFIGLTHFDSANILLLGRRGCIMASTVPHSLQARRLLSTGRWQL